VKNYKKDYYKVLNIPHTSSLDDIKNAYKELSKLYHPDITKGSDKMMKKINEAYSILGDIENRYDYDKWYTLTILQDAAVFEKSTVKAKIFNSETHKIKTLNIEIDRLGFDIEKYKDRNNFIYFIEKNTVNIPSRTVYTRDDWLMQISYISVSQLYITREYANVDDSFFADEAAEYGMYLHQYRLFLESLCRELLNTVNNRNGDTYNKNAGTKKKTIPISILIVVIIFFFAFVLGSLDKYFNRHEYNPTTITGSNEIIKPTSIPMRTKPPVQAVPENGFTNYVYSKNSSNNTLITFETSTTDSDAYYYIKFYDSYDNTVVKDVFLWSGADATIVIPCGSYYIKYVAGDTWYGYEHYFDNDNCYSLTDTDTNTSVHTFTNDYTYTYTLYGVYDGNIETRSQDISKF